MAEKQENLLGSGDIRAEIANLPVPKNLQWLDFISNRYSAMRGIAADFLKGRVALPASITTSEAAVAVMIKGAELGFKPMQSFAAIEIIQGRATVKPQAMLNLIIGSGQVEVWKYVKTDETACTIYTKRKNGMEIEESFTIEDAKRIMTKEDNKVIPLVQKFNWKNMPKVMLRWRCIAAVGRLIYPDIIEGCYLPDEIDDQDIAFDAPLPPEVQPAGEKAGKAKPAKGKVIEAEFKREENAQEPGAPAAGEPPAEPVTAAEVAAAGEPEAIPPASAGEVAAEEPGEPVEEDPDVKLSAQQLEQLRAKIAELGTTAEKIAKYCDLPRIEDIPAVWFVELMKKLDEKLQEKKTQNAGQPAEGSQKAEGDQQNGGKSIEDMVKILTEQKIAYSIEDDTIVCGKAFKHKTLLTSAGFQWDGRRQEFIFKAA